MKIISLNELNHEETRRETFSLALVVICIKISLQFWILNCWWAQVWPDHVVFLIMSSTISEILRRFACKKEIKNIIPDWAQLLPWMKVLWEEVAQCKHTWNLIRKHWGLAACVFALKSSAGFVFKIIGLSCWTSWNQTKSEHWSQTVRK